MKKIIIAAIAKNRVIGLNGKLPWNIPEDLEHFKQLTLGHSILMGRKTFESIGHPLPHRRNVVLSSHSIAGIETYPSLESAFNTLSHEENIFIIGGANVFSCTLSMADEFFLTLLNKDFNGDVFFPEYEYLLSNDYRLNDEKVFDEFRFVHYIKRSD